MKFCPDAPESRRVVATLSSVRGAAFLRAAASAASPSAPAGTSAAVALALSVLIPRTWEEGKLNIEARALNTSSRKHSCAVRQVINSEEFSDELRRVQ